MSVFDRAKGRGWGLGAVLVLAVSACGKDGQAPPGEVVAPVAETAKPDPAESKDTETRPAAPKGPTCIATDRGDESPGGVAVQWESGIDCSGAPLAGTFEASVKIENANDLALEVVRIELIQVVPGPLRKMMHDGRITASADPVTIPPKTNGAVILRGKYVLATDERRRSNANLKLMMMVKVGDFDASLPVNLHLRGETGPEPAGQGKPSPGDPREQREPGDD